MAMNDYQVTITSKGANLRLRLKYKDGRFKSLEWLSGQTANQNQYEWLMKFAPQLEAAILILEIEWKGKVKWEKVEKSESLWGWFIDQYSTWYFKITSLQPRITGTEGKALKSIIQHLNSVCKNENEIKETWTLIFKRWNDLTAFYQSQTELRQINSNLNIILRQLGSVSKAESLDDKFKEMLKQ